MTSSDDKLAWRTCMASSGGHYRVNIPVSLFTTTNKTLRTRNKRRLSGEHDLCKHFNITAGISESRPRMQPDKGGELSSSL
ncbi:hypothetical protein E2C01_083254 [Portunus trituberculatus]|uniref:Uncharacterized protein n=1 Tax=Portunus trituberculatus TaxID=210409 RepID=A0A5B7J1H3_PORTR|nr:hypothetical protein [Portunus trituberculatus]